MRRFPFRLAVCGLAAAAFIIVLPGYGSASAQSRKELQQQITRLEKEVRALQRRVFPNAQFDQGTEFLEPEGADGSNQRAVLADMEARLITIERQMRMITGQVEEAEFRNQELARQLDLLKSDFEFRFQAIEGGGGGAANSQAASTPSSGTGLPGLVKTTTPEQAEALLNGSPPTSEVVDTPAVQEAGLPGGTPEQQYEYARSLIMRGDYEGAEKAMSAFLEAHPDHQLAANAQYWLGETYYERKDFPRAAGAFLAGIQKYATGNKGPDSLLKLGMSLGAMGNTDEACQVLGEMEVRYPQAPDHFFRDSERAASRLGCS